MTLTGPNRVDRREALVASSLAAAVFVVVGYATGLGITTPSSSAGTAISAPSAGSPPINYVVPPGPDMTSLVPVAATAAVWQVAPKHTTNGAPTPAGSGTTGPRPGGVVSTGATATSRSSCKGLSAAEQTLLQHVFAAHLGESPSQQLTDILNADQYAKSHTVLVSSLLQSLIGGVTGAEDTLLHHLYAGHLGESPSQQLADILNADQYINNHTALTSSMLQSIVGAC